MKHCSNARRLLAVVAAALVLASPCSFAQECGGRALTTSNADVYENPPRYSTGVGWQGVQIEQLPSGTAIYVCRELNMEFGFSTRTWVQIGYRAAGSEWRYGWILKETLRMAGTRSRAPESFLLALVPAANASESLDATTAGADWGAPPPLPAGPRAEFDAQESRGALTWADLSALYGPLFVAMLIGMVVKVAVDCVDTWDHATRDRTKLRAHLRNGAIAILVSPIVFLGFLNAGQFPSAKQTFLVLALLAFQNGFFWQTVLKKAER